MSKPPYDAIVVGAGPNGLAAAIELAKRGKRVCIFEANETVGGSARSAALTLPDFVHDTCSAVHPLAVGSPFFKSLSLAEYGLEFIYPPAALAHPFDDGSAILFHRSVEKTSEQLGADAHSYRKVLGPFVKNWEKLAPALLGPLRFPRHPFALAHFGLHAIRTASSFARANFKTSERVRCSRVSWPIRVFHSISLARPRLGWCYWRWDMRSAGRFLAAERRTYRMRWQRT